MAKVLEVTARTNGLGAQIDRLPAYLTRFVGREAEIDVILDQLARFRVVTLCGVGGSGKTRLVIEVAKRIQESPGGPSVEAYWVPLETVTDPAGVVGAVADSLSCVGQVGGTALGLRNALKDRSVLLVLDNCEQVGGACRDLLADLLPDCPGLRVLTTSRVPLQEPDEQVFAMPPLGDAAELFLDRTSLVAPAWVPTVPDTDSIQQICGMLRGLPLAVELAASWIRVLSPRDLLAELRQTSEALGSRSAPVADRHRSMSVILDASWQWLDEAERTVLSALAVFVGGFTREAADEVAGATLPSLATLTERALIQRLPHASGESRYLMHELVRSHALHHLQSPDVVRERHFAFFLSIVERETTHETTPVTWTWSHPMGPELGNIGAALSWALDQGDADGALRMVVALCAFWHYSVPTTADRLVLLERALELPWAGTTQSSIRARADALEILAVHQFRLRGRTELARDMLHEASRMFTAVGDQSRSAGCLRNHAVMLMILGDPAACRREQRRSLAMCRAVGDRHGEAWSISYLGQAELTAGNAASARSFCGDALKRFELLDDSYGIYGCRVDLVVVCRQDADCPAAIDVARSALRDWKTHRFTIGVSDLIDGLAMVALDLHQFEAAAELMAAAEGWRQAYQEIGEPYGQDPFERGAAAVRSQLSEQAWTAARARGSQWSTDGLIDRVAHVIEVLDTVLRARPSGLTSRELEVLRLLTDGMSNAAIAEQLVVSRRTVHAHMRSIFAKLGVTNRTAASRKAADLLPHS